MDVGEREEMIWQLEDDRGPWA